MRRERQAIDLLRLANGVPQRDPVASASGHAAEDVDEAAHRVDADDPHALDGDAFAAHTTGHLLALPHLARVLTGTGRAALSMRLRHTVRGGHTSEPVPLHDASETLPVPAHQHVQRDAERNDEEMIDADEVPQTSTFWPGRKCSTDSSVPAFTTALGDTENSTRCAFGLRPAAAQCIFSAFVAFLSFLVPAPTWRFTNPALFGFIFTCVTKQSWTCPGADTDQSPSQLRVREIP